MTTGLRDEADVVVVGGRCAGAATAMLLARAGRDVLVVDRATFPSDANSTHSIARPGVIQLARWGLLPRVLASGAPPIRRVDFHSDEGIDTRYVKDRHGVDFLVNPRRYALDALLLDAARDAGARVLTGCAVDGLRRDGRGAVAGVTARTPSGQLEVRASYVVGADGLGSRVAQWAGAPRTDVRPSSGASQYAYFAGDWPAIEYHVGELGFAGVFPTHGAEACVWVCCPESRARRHRRGRSADHGFMRALADVAPALAERAAATERRSSARGVLRMPNHRRLPYGAGWALVGDAGLHRDPVSGFGISDAFRDAELLAEALDVALDDASGAATALAAYECERDRLARPVFDVTQRLAAFPGAAAFTDQVRQLAVAIEQQSEALALRPWRLTPTRDLC